MTAVIIPLHHLLLPKELLLPKALHCQKGAQLLIKIQIIPCFPAEKISTERIMSPNRETRQTHWKQCPEA